MDMILIDTEKQRPEIIDCDGQLEDLYRFLRCERIDITAVNIGGHYYDVITDDETLLYRASHAIPTALGPDLEPVLTGNLIICNVDEEGREVGLSAEDVQRILHHVLILTARDDDTRHWPAVEVQP